MKRYESWKDQRDGRGVADDDGGIVLRAGKFDGFRSGCTGYVSAEWRRVLETMQFLRESGTRGGQEGFVSWVYVYGIVSRRFQWHDISQLMKQCRFGKRGTKVFCSEAEDSTS